MLKTLQLNSNSNVSHADLAHLVERDLAKVEVAGSSPVIRSNGGLAQLGEHLPYKQRVTGSSPVPPTRYRDNEKVFSFFFFYVVLVVFFHAFIILCLHGPVVQLVRTPACHAGGRGFEPHPDRHFFYLVELLL